jgi:hypothetical protein
LERACEDLQRSRRSRENHRPRWPTNLLRSERKDAKGRTSVRRDQSVWWPQWIDHRTHSKSTSSTLLHHVMLTRTWPHSIEATGILHNNVAKRKRQKNRRTDEQKKTEDRRQKMEGAAVSQKAESYETFQSVHRFHWEHIPRRCFGSGSVSKRSFSTRPLFTAANQTTSIHISYTCMHTVHTHCSHTHTHTHTHTHIQGKKPTHFTQSTYTHGRARTHSQNQNVTHHIPHTDVIRVASAGFGK